MQTLVDLDVSLEDAPARAERIVETLRADGILGAPILVERWVGDPWAGNAKPVRDHRVWPPGPKVFDALDVEVVKVTKGGVQVRKNGQTMTVFDFRKQDPNHVDAAIGWELRCSDGVAFRCPHCDAEHPSPWDEDGATGVVDALAAARAGGPPELTCPKCRRRVRLADLRAEPPAAFGALAFTFANWWPLRASTIARMQEVGGGRIASVWL